MKNIFTLLFGLLAFIFQNHAQTVTDYDGNNYNTVTIGSQTWLKENLKVTHYRNGDLIPNIIGGVQWANLTTGAYCYFNNDTNYASTYGALYNWYTVNDSRNICPTGWYVPTHNEWTILEREICTSGTCDTDFPFDLITYGQRGTDEGGKLKESGTTYWTSPNVGATNETDFTALPSGSRAYLDGSFISLGWSSTFWSSTEANDTTSFSRALSFNHSTIFRGYGIKECGFSVRCIKDSTTSQTKKNNYYNSYPIYPNPAKETVIIEGLQAGTIEIINSTGMVIKNIDVSNEKSTIDISELSGGVYIIRIITNDRIIVNKLMKQ